jgi:hypothetical protein
MVVVFLITLPLGGQTLFGSVLLFDPESWCLYADEDGLTVPLSTHWSKFSFMASPIILLMGDRGSFGFLLILGILATW